MASISSSSSSSSSLTGRGGPAQTQPHMAHRWSTEGEDIIVVGAAAHVEEERAEPGQADSGEAFPTDQPDTHDQQPDTGDLGHLPAEMISFSSARQFSPYQAGTSSHAEPFIPHIQEHTGLDELFHMTSCPSAEFTNTVESFRVSQAQHVDHASSSSVAPPPPPPPAFDVQHGQWILTYSSPPVMGFSVFDPIRIGSEYATHHLTRRHLHIVAAPSTDTTPRHHP
ncbi:hypothetical protein PIB30_068572 [Stylosanthes scabra]|uniref:Uncharacterized protein n=1 Tax=Stylosanthes scabra TaxID=79078 RepID=A0ABU6WL70_9FABA|nr:hypothetical protein [Stylosanthes scabra]